jgi:hypothetical protein
MYLGGAFVQGFGMLFEHLNPLLENFVASMIDTQLTAPTERRARRHRDDDQLVDIVPSRTSGRTSARSRQSSSRDPKEDRQSSSRDPNEERQRPPTGRSGRPTPRGAPPTSARSAGLGSGTAAPLPSQLLSQSPASATPRDALSTPQVVLVSAPAPPASAAERTYESEAPEAQANATGSENYSSEPQDPIAEDAEQSAALTEVSETVRTDVGGEFDGVSASLAKLAIGDLDGGAAGNDKMSMEGGDGAVPSARRQEGPTIDSDADDANLPTVQYGDTDETNNKVEDDRNPDA